ncbi:tetratricopeptide repeat protein [Psychroserpens sp. SPM9]|uniref:tetratricopeptide repeat protein n=1 Tax=Psychroserpens sp. SPM9 TaxID=2975598 RepID=UPI0021A96C47|nr:tetratricopeptide repeat protein [Psychroserpens sp. SPM9]MDG5493199.1 tetratricopeptide repeat protein [Psychroserpens sp. SPM9]
MRRFTILLLILFISCANKEDSECNYITDYYPYTAKAEVEFYKGNYEDAYKYYQKAFKNCEAIRMGMQRDTDFFAKVCAELNKESLAIEYIKKAISKGSTLGTFQNDESFNNIFKSEQGKKLIEEYDNMRQKYINSLNMDLRNEIQEMIKIDQALLGHPEERIKVFKKNDKRLVEILEKLGYPNEQVVGNFGVDFSSADPRILLLHTDDSIRMSYFIPKIKELVKKGQCPPITLGSMYDNLEIYNDRPQTHGTYKNSRGNSNMIPDINRVNTNRKEIGLPSLKITKTIDSLKSL